MKKNILYVERNVDGTVGGSHFCLLDIVKRVDKNVYNPMVIFYQDNQLVPAFRKAGCTVRIISSRLPVNIRNWPFVEKLATIGVAGKILLYPLFAFQKAFNYLTGFILPAVFCWNFLRKENISIVHLNNTLMGPQQWILASILAKARIIAHERGINKTFPLQARFWASFLDRIICISGAVKANLLSHGFPEERLALIYDGLDPADFRSMVKKNKAEVFREFDLKPGAPLIGIIGNIKIWKGQETLVRAMRYVKHSCPAARCIIVGAVSNRPADQAYAQRLRSIVSENDLGEYVIFAGHRSDIPSIVNALDVLVHASIEPEPFGRVNLEAMALGKPVISTTIGAGPEIIEHGRTGFVVPPNDDLALADAITKLISDPDRSALMGRQGSKRLDDIFHLTINIRSIEKTYAGMMR